MTARSLSTWLTAEVDEDEDAVQIALQGAVDGGSAAGLRKLLRSYSDTLVVLDLAAMTLLDTDGVTVLLAARQVAERSGGALVLQSVPAHRRYLIELLGAECLLADAEVPPAPGQHRRRFANRSGAVEAVRAYVAAQLAGEPPGVRAEAVGTAAQLAAHALEHTDADFSIRLERDAALGVRVELASIEGPSARGSSLGGLTRRVLPLHVRGERLTSLSGRPGPSDG